MHQHTLLAGMTGAGKTTLVKALLRRTARAVVFDPELEYDLPGATVAETLPEAMQAFTDNRWQPFTLIFRGERPEEFVRLLDLIMYAQEVEPHGPIVIVVEESSLFSTTMHMDETVHRIMNRGRKRRVSLLLVIQLDSDIHRVAKANTRVKVCMHSDQISTRFEGYFRVEDVQSLKSLSDAGEYTPSPKQGRHFLVYPPHVRLYDNWYDTFGYVHAPDGAKDGTVDTSDIDD